MTSNDSPWRGGGSLTPMVIYCIISIQILSAPRSHAAAIRIVGELRALFITDFCPVAEMELWTLSEHNFITFLRWLRQCSLLPQLRQDNRKVPLRSIHRLQVPSNIQKAGFYLNKQIAHTLTLHARAFKVVTFSSDPLFHILDKLSVNIHSWLYDDHYSEYVISTFVIVEQLGHVALVTELVKRWVREKDKVEIWAVDVNL
ncbi:hypothetical protein CsSME_00034584 [Camellia sinensis var. sinensis]